MWRFQGPRREQTYIGYTYTYKIIRVYYLQNLRRRIWNLSSFSINKLKDPDSPKVPGHFIGTNLKTLGPLHTKIRLKLGQWFLRCRKCKMFTDDGRNMIALDIKIFDLSIQNFQSTQPHSIYTFLTRIMIRHPNIHVNT